MTKLKPLTLSGAQQKQLREQIVIVLADYQRCKVEDMPNEAADRIMTNLALIARRRDIERKP